MAYTWWSALDQIALQRQEIVETKFERVQIPMSNEDIELDVFV